ncbi:S8 family peptidase [Flavobacterium sp. MC2016-06]|uniref:S8 family peptidase n=1 Tax=Flavobacterium sp. MC2016-06 TaxID=2676308 RepID=UPI0012BACBB8|nr:S8 family peptidase [Flavobacterium sp. MC2016-06]MBU3859125.1 S8 family peptidase [Flavobacterium sp. MC2016-06]
MERFPHLKFLQKITGKPRLNYVPNPNETTQKNLNNRVEHYGYLSQKTSSLKASWLEEVSQRENNDLPPLDKNVIPIFLQINPDLIGNDFDLKSFGIEIISQEEDGFIIGASLDGLNALNSKIKKFVNQEYGGTKIADFWKIIIGNQWKPENILSEYLLSLWKNINDNEIFAVEIGIAFDKPLGKEPDPTKQGGKARLQKHRDSQVERDDKLMERQDQFDEFIKYYGERLSSFIDLEDSFSCKIEITGKGLKDLVENYPFVFEVSEIDKINAINGSEEEEAVIEIQIVGPEDNSPEIAVIDSGIMEEHKYLSASIIARNSKSYVIGDKSTADHVLGGGHGTRVAGAILYPYGLPKPDDVYQLPCFVRNIRVLNHNNELVNTFPAQLMQEIVEDNSDCKVFNLSINSTAPYRLKHMSSWAATIDNLINQNRILFIISAGNIDSDVVRDYISKGNNYPDFLNEPYCRLANPAQSCFALTIGSINHSTFEDNYWKSLGDEQDVSAFSRIGTGIWGMIKPDVVEFGGGFVISKSVFASVRNNEFTSPELLRSTLNGGNAFGKDRVGTSFATPKVSHIVAQLLKLYPNEDVNLLRGLVVQGARLPKDFFINPTSKSIRCLGYGIPSLDRVTNNTHQRITFYNTNNIKVEEAHIYSLKIPDSLRSPAEEYDILIEVTLSYTAKVRRTRQKTKSYLSTWLDWTSSKLGEPLEDFKDYVLSEIEKGQATSYDKDLRNDLTGWNWKIKNTSRGPVEGINRTNSTIQKDWSIIKSHDLPNELSFAVRAHKGWDKMEEEVSYSLVVSIEILNSSLEIYEAIRIENEIELET